MKNRVIKRYGNSHAVKLEIADMKDYNLNEGEEIDMEPTFNELKKENNN